MRAHLLLLLQVLPGSCPSGAQGSGHSSPASVEEVRAPPLQQQTCTVSAGSNTRLCLLQMSSKDASQSFQSLLRLFLPLLVLLLQLQSLEPQQ